MLDWDKCDYKPDHEWTENTIQSEEGYCEACTYELITPLPNLRNTGWYIREEYREYHTDYSKRVIAGLYLYDESGNMLVECGNLEAAKEELVYLYGHPEKASMFRSFAADTAKQPLGQAELDAKHRHP